MVPWHAVSEAIPGEQLVIDSSSASPTSARVFIRTATDQTFVEAAQARQDAPARRRVSPGAGGRRSNAPPRSLYRPAAAERECARGLEEKLAGAGPCRRPPRSICWTAPRSRRSTRFARRPAPFAAEAGVDLDFAVHDPVMTERRRQEKWRTSREAFISRQ
jgi:hypothetical protein